MVWGSRHTRSSLIGLGDVVVLSGRRWEPSSGSCHRHCSRLYIRGLKFEYTVTVLFRGQYVRGEQERLGVGVRSKSGGKNKGGVRVDRGQMGLWPQCMCCATTYILVPIYQAGNTLQRGLQGMGDILSLSESIGGGQMMWRMSRMMRTRLRGVWGQKTLIFELGDREIHVGS